MRGLAALSVAFFHVVAFNDAIFSTSLMPRWILDLFGVYGVAVFFAISGYLMSDLIRKQDPVQFIIRRGLRIYPVFILATVGVMTAHPKIWSEYNLLSMSLAPMGETRYPLGQIEWTLIFEVFFYIALFIVSVVGLRRYATPIAAIWCVLIIAAAVAGIQETSLAYISDLPLRPACIGLAGGFLIARTEAVGVKVALAISALSLVLAYISPDVVALRLSAGVGCVFLIAAIAKMPDFLPYLLRPAFKKMGDWSYGIYLIHMPVIVILFQPMTKTFGTSVLPLRLAVVIAAGAVVGEVDKFIHERTRRLPIDGKGWPAKSTVAIFLMMYAAIAIAYV